MGKGVPMRWHMKGWVFIFVMGMGIVIWGFRYYFS